VAPKLPGGGDAVATETTLAMKPAKGGEAGGVAGRVPAGAAALTFFD
jgi:hypothetical protein